MATIEAAKFLSALSVIVSVASIILVTLITWSFNLWGPQLIERSGLATTQDIRATESRFEGALTGLSEQVSSLASSVELNARTVAVLAQPEDIAIYRDLPRPVNGTCEAGSVCTLLIYAVRDPRAIECKILPGRAELVIESGGIEYRQRIVSRGNTTNIGTVAQGLEPSFMIPRSLAGQSQVTGTIVSYYEDCPWQDRDGQPPAIGFSPEFTIQLVP
jgi:hypothetical protein